MRPPVSTLTVATITLIGLALACGPAGDPASNASRQAPLVEAVPARFGALPIEESMPGMVRARNQVAIRPETAGRIVSVLAQIGDAVERGRLLVRLDDSEARERLRQAQADVRLAEAGAAAARARLAELEARVARTRALAEQQLVSAQELESLEAQLAALRASADEEAARVEQRQAAVEESRSALAKTEVRAPVAGQLGERRAEIGMRVDPSSVLFVVGDLDQLVVEVNLTEAMLSRIREGLPVVIEGARDSTSEPIRAELSRVSPFLAEESFTAVGEIDVDNRPIPPSEGAGPPARRLRPGMFVTVRILVGESRQATLVPVSAIWENPASGALGVFVVEDADGLEEPAGVATESPEEPRGVSFRAVEVLAEGPAAAGVTGIEEGDWVVIVGQQLLDAETRADSTGSPGPDTEGLRARVRPASWQRILALQDLQDEDLLEGFLDKQRKIAAALGAEIPESEDEVDRVLAQADSERPPPGSR